MDDRVKINDEKDSELLSKIFESEEPLLRSILLFTYGRDSKLPNFALHCIQSKNEEIKEFLNFFNEFTENHSIPQASFLSYVKIKTPKWEEAFSQIDKQYKSTEDYLNELISLELPLNDSYSIIQSKLIEYLTNFMDNFKKCRFLMSQMSGSFSDFSLFLNEAESKINKSISFLVNFDNDELKANFFNDLYENNDMEVFVHYAIAESLNNRKEKAIDFLKSELIHISNLRDSIPDFNSFFEKYRIQLKKFEPILESKLFEQLNTFYHFVLAKESVLFAKSKISSFALNIFDSSQKEDLYKTIDDELLRTFQTFKLFCASMGFKRPNISEENSKYKMSKIELDAIEMKRKLIETDEIDEEIMFIDEGINEMNQYSSICISCQNYCASYVCPNCHLCLYCLLCKKTNQFCPGCYEYFEEPLLIKKTCYIGDEFRIDLLNQRAREEKLKEKKEKKRKSKK